MATWLSGVSEQAAEAQPVSHAWATQWAEAPYLLFPSALSLAARAFVFIECCCCTLRELEIQGRFVPAGTCSFWFLEIDLRYPLG